jgi:hypothetical protein
MSHRSHNTGLFGYEHKQQPLISQQSFVRRFVNGLLIAGLLLGVWLVLGMIGYHWLGRENWVDAFLNASMIVGGMGPVDVLPSDAAKIFAGWYAIFSGVIFLGIFGLVIAPIYHRFLHRFHLESAE